MSAYISVAPIAESTPGFSFGRSGTCSAGTYLQIDSVPSNRAGRIVPFEAAFLANVFIVCENNSTFTIEIQKRVGNTFTTVHTSTVTSARKFTEIVENVEFVLGDEVCLKIGSGSCSNVIVGLIIKGL